MATRKCIVLSCALLSGCAATLESTSVGLDSIEESARLARVLYQERLDRVSMEWICTGMSWTNLVSLTGGNQELIDTVMQTCAARTFPSVQSSVMDAARD